MIDTNNVTNYWDYSPRERASLSREDLVRFVAFELMQRGVLRVAAPVLHEVPPEPELPKRRYWVLKDGYATLALFENETHALAASEMKIYTEGSLYFSGGHGSVKYADRVTGPTIEPIMLPTEEDATAAKKLFAERAAVLAENAKASEAYKKASEAEEKAMESLYADWHEQRANDEAARSIRLTWEEYLGHCNGDEAVALVFLEKVKSRDEIAEAFAWLELPSPYPKGERLLAVAKSIASAYDDVKDADGIPAEF
jgi:hypothetical protein